MALLWKDNLEIEILFEDKNLLDLRVQCGSKKWFISCVNEHPVMKMRPLLWERMNKSYLQMKEAWCMIGDFNDLRSNAEKLGSPTRHASTFRPFCNMLEICDMSEMGSTGMVLLGHDIKMNNGFSANWIDASEMQHGFLYSLTLTNGFWKSLDPIINQFWLNFQVIKICSRDNSDLIKCGQKIQGL